MKTFTAAAFAATLFVSVVATAAQADIREPVTMTIRYGDLDLSRADQRAVLDARINRAANIACGVMTGDIHRNMDIGRCRKEMRANAVTRLASLSQRSVALASNR